MLSNFNIDGRVRPFDLLDDLDECAVFASNTRSLRHSSKVILRRIARLQSMQPAHCEAGWASLEVTMFVAILGMLVIGLLNHFGVVTAFVHALGVGLTHGTAGEGLVAPLSARRSLSAKHERAEGVEHNVFCRPPSPRPKGEGFFAWDRCLSAFALYLLATAGFALIAYGIVPQLPQLAANVQGWVALVRPGDVPVMEIAAGMCIVPTLLRVCFGYYVRTDRASWGILDNSLTLVVFGVGVIVVAAVFAPGEGLGGSLLHDLGSLVGAHSGSVGGGA